MLKGKPLVMIGVPSAGIWDAPMGHNAVMLAAISSINGIFINCTSWDGCYVEMNRNNIVRTALEYEAEIDAILWLDSDMNFPPEALVRLWNRHKEIVGALYRERVAPWGYLGTFLDGNDLHCRQGGMHRMKNIPGGMALVKMGVYRKVPRPWYRAPVEGHGEERDDYYFCSKARAAGYDVWADMDLTPRIAHRNVKWYEGMEQAAAKVLPAVA